MAEKPHVAAAPAPAQVKCRLNQAHTHAGVEYRPGGELELRSDQAERLAEGEAPVLTILNAAKP